METIGSRLRKRRRTSPLPHDEDTEDMSTTPKRANSRKTVSGRGKRGQADTLGQEMIHSSNTEMQASSEDLPKTENSSPKAPPPVTGPSEQPRQEEPASHQLPRFEQRSIQGVSTPDINDVVAGIMNHGDTVDTFAAQSNAIGMVDTESFRRLGASLHLKTQSLQVLDNLVNCSSKSGRLGR